MTRVTADNLYGLSDYIVDSSSQHGSYNTIQSAYNAADSAGGGTIYIRAVPGGGYSENLTLNSTSQIQIIGVAADSVAGTGNYIQIAGTATYSASGVNCFSNILFLGVIDSAIVFNSAGNMNAEFINCTVQTFANHGMFLSGGDLIIKADNCNISGQNSGCTMNGNSIQGVFVDCSISGNNDTAFIQNAVAGSTSQLRNCQLQGAGFGIEAGAGQSLIVTNSFVTGPNGAGIITAGGQIRFFNSQAFTSAGSGFTFSGTGQLVYDGIISEANVTLDPGLTLTPLDWQPYAQQATAPATPTAGQGLRGTACFDDTQFTVTAGFVQASGLVSTISADGNSAIPTAGNIALVSQSGANLGFSAPSTILIRAPAYGQANASGLMAENTVYFTTNAITRSLPATVQDGLTNGVVVTDASAVVVTPTSGTSAIRIGSSISSAGGTATSTAIGDVLVLRYNTVDDIWYAVEMIGNWTLA